MPARRARPRPATAAPASSSQTVGRYASRAAEARRDPAARGLDVGLREVAVRPDEEAEAQDDRVAREELRRVRLGDQRRRGRAAAGDRRVLVEPGVAAVGVEEGERLLDEPRGAGVLRRPRDRPRTRRAAAGRSRPMRRRRHPVGGRDVGEEVDDGVRARERGRQGRPRSKTSASTARAPRSSSSRRPRADRVTPATRWPAASSSRTARRPTTPVAPVMTIELCS